MPRGLTRNRLRINLATMKTFPRFVFCVIAAALLGLIAPVLARDFGDSKDVQQVRKAVPKKFGKVLAISVSHDWALSTTYSDEDSLSVVLHGSGSNWKVIQSDGGAYNAQSLKALGVSAGDIPSLLKVYQ
jgi:hypothetical protein